MSPQHLQIFTPNNFMRLVVSTTRVFFQRSSFFSGSPLSYLQKARVFSTFPRMGEPRRFAPLKDGSDGKADELPKLKGIVFDVDGTLWWVCFWGFLFILLQVWTGGVRLEEERQVEISSICSHSCFWERIMWGWFWGYFMRLILLISGLDLKWILWACEEVLSLSVGWY